jgi:hypothetical protein
MAITVIELRPIVAILGGFLLGAYGLRCAWLILVRSQTPLTPTHRAALWLLRRLGGDSLARDRELQLKDPGSRRAEGIWWLAGVILMLYGLLNLLAVVLGWTPLFASHP